MNADTSPSPRARLSGSHHCRFRFGRRSTVKISLFSQPHIQPSSCAATRAHAAWGRARVAKLPASPADHICRGTGRTNKAEQTIAWVIIFSSKCPRRHQVYFFVYGCIANLSGNPWKYRKGFLRRFPAASECQRRRQVCFYIYVCTSNLPDNPSRYRRGFPRRFPAAPEC